MPSEFTYPDIDPEFEKEYLRVLIEYLKSKGETTFAKLLKDSECRIIKSDTYSRKLNGKGRWDALGADVHFLVSVDNLDTIKEEKDKEKLRKYCDEILDPRFGYDIKKIEIKPLIDRTSEGTMLVQSPEPKISSEVVERAIRDAEASIKASNAISGVDRVHTALHGYLRAVCDREDIIYGHEDSMARLFKLLRHHHPALQDLGASSLEIERILQSFATIMDVLNPIRNNATLAHANVDLLGKNEAMLVINVARTILHYLDAKIGST